LFALALSFWFFLAIPISLQVSAFSLGYRSGLPYPLYLPATALAVIPFVRNYLFYALEIHLPFSLHGGFLRFRSPATPLTFSPALKQGSPVPWAVSPLIGFLQKSPAKTAPVSMSTRMFRFVCQMGAAILHLGDPRISFMRIHPVFIARFVLPVLIDAWLDLPASVSRFLILSLTR